jgi:hypothetical protein
MPYLGPNTVFRLRNVVKKVTIFSAPSPIQMLYQGVATRGMCPLLFEGFEGGGVPLIAKKILGM